jgi:alkaline phosphatase D
MVGYADPMEVALWVQTTAPAAIQIAYWRTDSAADLHLTTTHQTTAQNAHTAHLIADQVQPNQRYTYQLFINNQPVHLPYPTTFATQPVWKWRTDAPNFTFTTGSCNYINEPKYDRPGRGYGVSYDIFKTIAAQKPNFMLWLGDNTYLREADWNTRTGIYHRYTHTRQIPELQSLLAATHQYAIWDDHDYGTNDSDETYMYKDLTTQAFKDFWANPNYNKDGGTAGSFVWNDCDFFLLDNRYFRTNDKLLDKPKGTILGKNQLEWFKQSLLKSDAAFKFVAMGGQFLNTAAVYETYSICPQERNDIINFIHDNEIKNVIFITGDRHFSELSKLETKGKPTIYDFTASPLTSTAVSIDKAQPEANTLRVANSLICQNNFGEISVEGNKKDRKIVIYTKDATGKVLFKQEIIRE